MHCDSDFEALLDSFDISPFEEHHNTVYGIRSDMQLAYYNPAWIRFAQDNGASPALWSDDYLGTSVVSVIGDALSPFYLDLFRSCLDARDAGLRPPQHEYECSSADVFRQFLMTLYPLAGRRGLLVVNSLIAEMQHDPVLRPRHASDSATYVGAGGWTHQCAHCRRVENTQIDGQWDWVPEWVDHPLPKTSHGLCGPCRSHYYPQ